VTRENLLSALANVGPYIYDVKISGFTISRLRVNGSPDNGGSAIFQCMLERTDATTNEVLEPITFVLAYPTLYV
jgi:hypothetical protein